MPVAEADQLGPEVCSDPALLLYSSN